MRERTIGGGLAGLVLLAHTAGAHEVPGICRVTEMVNDVVSFGVVIPISTAAGVDLPVTIDAEEGRFVLDARTVAALPHVNGFSPSGTRDVFDFADEVFAGTIDNAGTVVLPGVRFDVCTAVGSTLAPGSDCVPDNLCSNDVSRVCDPAAEGDTGCAGSGVCQGVCSNERARTCAGDGDCAPPGVCGTGRQVPFSMNLSTGTSTFGTFTVRGSALDFATGMLTLNAVTSTAPQSPIVQDTGVTSLRLSCVLDPVPAAAELPAPPGLTVQRGRVKLGRVGAGAADDSLTLTGVFSPLAGEADFAADDLVVTLGPPGVSLLSLRIPAGQLATRGRRLTLRDTTGVVRVTPSVPGAPPPRHKILLKRARERYRVKISSRGLDLDALVAEQVETAVTVGFQSARAVKPARSARRSLRF
jgi:hypothetical protein